MDLITCLFDILIFKLSFMSFIQDDHRIPDSFPFEDIINVTIYNPNSQGHTQFQINRRSNPPLVRIYSTSDTIYPCPGNVSLHW